MSACNKSLQASLKWCEGAVSMPGIRKRLYFISKSKIVAWPEVQKDSDTGRPSTSVLSGSFALAADATWNILDILPDKSQLTSEAQGEAPSQTQLNKLTAVHPGVEQNATWIAAALNNDDNVFLVEDQDGFIRVVGSQGWPTKTTVAQDNGQGATGTTSTTITVEATDIMPAPFYEGQIITEDGTIAAAVSGKRPFAGTVEDDNNDG